MDTARFDRIKAAIGEIPVIDIHTHIGTMDKWQAADLVDLLFFHPLGSELRNAGCPEEVSTPLMSGLNVDLMDPRERVRLAVPFCAAIRNTSTYWSFATVLKDLYGIDGGLTEDNWEKAYDAVLERAGDTSWESEVLKRAGIEKTAIDYNSSPKDPSAYFSYAYVEPLYGVGLGKPDALFKMLGRGVSSGTDLAKALTNAVAVLASKSEIRALHVWLPASWRYTAIEEPEIDRLLYYWSTGENISSYEQNCLASFSADIMAREAGKHGLVVQLFHGSTAYGRGFQVGTWHQDYLRTLIYHVGKHVRTKYDILLATRNASHEATSMARMHTNLMVSGAWWHAFTPTTLTTFFRDRLEMLPHTRWNAFYSDAYCVEWSYGNLMMAKNRLSVALTGMVDEGLISEADVVPIARAVLYDNPKREYLGETG